jgi:hypothetical protein
MKVKYGKTTPVLLSSLLLSLSNVSFGHTSTLDTILTPPSSVLNKESALQSTWGLPLWTFEPLTATEIAVSPQNTATIQYKVTNQSRKSHTLVMLNMEGISQDTSLGNCANPFTLGYLQSCILTLTVDGSALQGNIVGGPRVCQQGNALQCYNPSMGDILNISLSSAPGTTTLSSSVPTLGISVNDTGLNPALTGIPRTITITNTGSSIATDVTYTPSPALPAGTIITPPSCGTIAAQGTCVLNIIPGGTPSAVPGNTNPTPITLSISGTNTNTLSPTLNIVTYGSVYQGGYLFSMDDTTPNTGSIGGYVVSQTDRAATFPNGVVWASNGVNNASVSNDTIPLISEVVTPSDSYNTALGVFNGAYPNSNIFPFPNAGAFSTCSGGTDGACNSANILTLYNLYITDFGATNTLSPGPTPATYYAAGLCSSSIDGYSDWHLPAICELSPEIAGSGSGCNIGIQNIVNQLPNLIGNPNAGTPSTSCVYGANCMSNYYWSSTQFAGSPRNIAWYQFYSSVPPGNSQFGAQKSNRMSVRCTRALTP